MQTNRTCVKFSEIPLTEMKIHNFLGNTITFSQLEYRCTCSVLERRQLVTTNVEDVVAQIANGYWKSSISLALVVLSENAVFGCVMSRLNTSRRGVFCGEQKRVVLQCAVGVRNFGLKTTPTHVSCVFQLCNRCEWTIQYATRLNKFSGTWCQSTTFQVNWRKDWCLCRELFSTWRR